MSDDETSLTEEEDEETKTTSAKIPLTPRTAQRRQLLRNKQAHAHLLLAMRNTTRLEGLLKESSDRNEELRMENAAKSLMLQEDAERRRTQHADSLPQSTFVTALPTISWADMPPLNFDDLTTLYPYMRRFEITTRLHSCPPAQQFALFRTLPQANEGCVATMVDLLAKETAPLPETYEAWRNFLLRKIGFLDPATALLLRMAQKTQNVKGTIEWIALARSTNAELDIALAVFPEKYTRESLTLALLTTVISAYSGNERMKLHRKLRDRINIPGVMDFILGTLPKWEYNIFLQPQKMQQAPQEPVLAAAAYRPTERQRPQKNRQATQFGGKTPIRFNNKRTDIPERPKQSRNSKPSIRVNCRNCGGTHAAKECPAWNSKCEKCNKSHHYTSLCRGEAAQKVKVD
jgi:hypothetical protein